jgi:hypothetical protein
VFQNADWRSLDSASDVLAEAGVALATFAIPGVDVRDIRFDVRERLATRLASSTDEACHIPHEGDEGAVTCRRTLRSHHSTAALRSQRQVGRPPSGPSPRRK